MVWFRCHSGLCDPAFNMAMDEALLETAPVIGCPVLRFYGWTQPASTFGYFQRYSDVEKATTLRPLIRRPTGGGIVPHDSDWTYSFTVPPVHEWYSFSAVESYRRVHAWIQGAFAGLKIETELAACCRGSTPEKLGPGINAGMPSACFIGYEKFDLLWHGKKIAGAAQRRNKSGLLIQGSVQPPLPLPRNLWEHAMFEAARDNFSVTWSELPPIDAFLGRVKSLALDKYSQAGFNRKR